MKCPYANVIDNSNLLFVNIQCYCMATSNPGNRRAEQTTVGVDLEKCANSKRDAFENCPYYKKG